MALIHWAQDLQLYREIIDAATASIQFFHAILVVGQNQNN